MIKVEITVATNDELLALAQKLSGVSYTAAAAEAPAKPAKADKEATNTAKGAEATKAAAAKKPAVITLTQLQDKIGEHSDGDTAKIKEFVASFGVKKISLLSEKQIAEAFGKVEEFFGGAEAEAEEEDPMG